MKTNHPSTLLRAQDSRRNVNNKNARKICLPILTETACYYSFSTAFLQFRAGSNRAVEWPPGGKALNIACFDTSKQGFRILRMDIGLFSRCGARLFTSVEVVQHDGGVPIVSACFPARGGKHRGERYSVSWPPCASLPFSIFLPPASVPRRVRPRPAQPEGAKV